jgi:CPA2 family monovalent cation:H+ antiporter-2
LYRHFIVAASTTLLVFLGEDTPTVPSFLLAIGKVFGLAIITYILGRILWPRLLEWFGRFGSAELTLVATLTLALGGGLAMQAIGLSFALGAFLAGMVLAEAPWRSEAVARIMPLRDISAAVFFVSIGTLFNPAVIWERPVPLLCVLGALIIGKAAVSAFIVRVFRYTGAIAILSGLLLAQIGEFSFILASIGLDQGAISESLFSVGIAEAVISILVNSLILDSGPPVLSFLARITRFGPLMKQPVVTFASAFMKYQPFGGKRNFKD